MPRRTLLSILLTFVLLPAARAQFTVPGTALPVTNLADNDRFGTAVALSADGATAVVGAPGTGPIIPSDGAVYIWVLGTSGWTLQQMLVAQDALGNGSLGSLVGAAVSLSADGNTVLVGGPFDNSEKGAAWVYIRDSQGAWHEQQKLIGDPDLTGQDYAAGQGNAVALSGDGNTAFVAGDQDDQATGAVWVFTRTGTTWTQQAKLVAANTPTSTTQGWSVACSYDGNTVLIGGPGYGNTAGEISQGIAWIWRRTAGVWSSTPAALNASDVSSTAQQGESVALSADGTIALVGAWGDASRKGSVVVWTFSAGQWTEQTRLQAPSSSGTGLGYSLSMTYNGSMALAGEPSDSNFRGSAYLFAVPAGGSPLQNLEVSSGHGQGFAVALSGYGAEALVGGPTTSNSQGAAWAYSAPATPITVETIPAGLPFSIDSVVFPTGPVTVNLPNGQYTIAVSSSETDSGGNPYQFVNWSDSGALSHSITVAGVGNTYTANFQTQQYVLTTQASPAAGGTVTPATGQSYNAKAMIAITATPANGYYFVNWTGSVANPNSASTSVAMSAAETVTANFALISSLPNTTIQTVPPGLQISVDGGAAQPAPAVLKLIPGSHTISAASPQAGPAGTLYVFASWSDGGAASHSIAAGASAATYTANFATQYQLTIAASPVAGGTVSPATGTYFNAGTVVPIAAAANAGYTFTGWTGGAASPSSASTTAAMSGPLSLTANFASLTGITIQTSPPGLQFSVDGGAAQTAPQVLTLSQGSHTIAVATMQSGAPGTQFQFASWSDGGAASHSISVGASAATYTANFTTQYQLTLTPSPAGGGTLTPSSGNYYNSGAVVPITATANAGYVFNNWTGQVSGSGASTSATMTAPLTIVANFSPVTAITIQTAPAGLQFSVDGGAAQSAPQTLNLTLGSHTIAVAGTQPGQPGTQFVFTGWSDGGAASHAIAVGAAAATYTASFKTQYQLTMLTAPANAGVITPASGTYFDANSIVPVGATPNAGYSFSDWTGPVTAQASPSTTVAMSAAETVTANFTAAQAPPAITVFSPSQGATGIPLNATLTWTATAGANVYDVYFGTSSPPPLAQPSTSLTSYSPALNYGVTYYWSVTARNAFGATPSAIWSFTTVASTAGLQFIPVAPCRVMDTRNAAGLFGGPSLAGGSVRNVPIPQSSCNIPSNAQAYSLNVTVVPPGPLTYLSIWPAGVAQPLVSTLNSFDGRVAANAAIVPAGIAPNQPGAISLYASDTTDVILDIDGYFVPAGGLSFYAVTPCRVVDTRGAAGPFGGPFVSAGSTRSFAVPSSSCAIPGTAQAYSLNITVVPHGSLEYLTAWPTGQAQPYVSTLNSFNGSVVANAAIVPAGVAAARAISVFATNDTDLIIDINGYFAPPGLSGALSLYTLTPCRVADTRNGPGPFGGPSLGANATRNFTIPSSSCAVPGTAQAYSLNVTVVPPGPVTYLTAWPAGQTQPVVSTLNSYSGTVVANAAIVPAGAAGAVSIFVSNPTDVILDINAYFAQ